MGCRSDLLGKLNQSNRTSNSFEIAVGFQFLRNGKQVECHMFVGKRAHGFEDHPVLLAIETVRRKLIHGFVDTVRLYKKGAEDSLFDIKSLRRSVSHLKPKCVQVYILFLSLTSHRSDYSKSGFTRILPQYSQMIIFLLEAMSISL